MGEGKRQTGIECLRIVAMAMVVTMHFLREAGALPAESAYEEITAVRIAALFLESFSIVAVNAYVLIGGYFGAEGRFRPSKVLSFLCRIWFYALLIPAVLFLAGGRILPMETGIYGLMEYVLPVFTEHYWFATSYFFLLLLMPLLGKAVRGLSRRQFQLILGALLVSFCGVKSLCPVPLSVDRYGYDGMWFVCLYLTAAYLRRYGSDVWKRQGLKLYIGSCLMIFLLAFVLWQGAGRFSGLAYFYSVPFHYNFALCLTGAIGLLFAFGRLEIKEGRTAGIFRRLGRYSFGIYLLHEHLDIRHVWYPFLRNVINPSGKTGLFSLLGELLFCLAVLFLAGFCIEWIREKLFHGAVRLLKPTRLYQKAEKWDAYFASEF